jgi:thiazole synthase
MWRRFFCNVNVFNFHRNLFHLSKTLTMSDLTIAGKPFASRLLIGSSRFPNPQTMMDAIEASGAEIVTVAIRRINLADKSSESILQYLNPKKYFLLPNTAGCYTAKDAVLTAQLAREALETNWVKLEVIGDDETLFPDAVELLKAAEQLIADGFTVLAYCNDDVITCRKLRDMGCAAVMPLASPIGSGMGIRNPYNLQIIREALPDVPLIIDAGIGTASDAAIAMELGYDGVLLNTAISQAQHPVQMARAMKLAVEAGRLAFEAGRIPRKLYATASSPIEGVIHT